MVITPRDSHESLESYAMCDRTDKCHAQKSNDRGLCEAWSGAGTNHRGSGRCASHGGASRNGVIYAARSEIQKLVLDDPTINPYSVLEGSIRRSWAEVLWLQEKMAQADGEDPTGVSSVALYQKLYGEWMDRAGKMSKMAMDAGVAERTVRLQEQQGQLLAQAIRTIFDGLGLTKAQQSKAPQLVRSTLLALEAG